MNVGGGDGKNRLDSILGGETEYCDTGVKKKGFPEGFRKEVGTNTIESFVEKRK